MPGNYDLDTKIEALDLLHRHDGDFQQVKSRLNIPIKTLAGWHMEEDKLRLMYEKRQLQQLADIRRELYESVCVFYLDITKKIMSGEHHGNTFREYKNSLSALLDRSLLLEKSFKGPGPNPQMKTEQLNQITNVYDNHLQTASLRTVENPEEPKPLKRSSQWQAPGEIEIGSVRHLESGTPETPTLPAGSRFQSDEKPELPRSGKRRQRLKRWRP